jgi:putative oxidoreductase
MRKLMMLLHASNDRMATLVRLVLGLVMFAHGAQKALGWFGGAGFGPTLTYFGQNLGIPAPLAVLAIAAEFVGGIFLLFGLLGRVSATGIAINMIVAALIHSRYGFFMNWFGAKSGEGIEYHLLALAMALVIVVRGSGAWSLDRMLVQNLDRSSRALDASATNGSAIAPAISHRGFAGVLRAAWARVSR